MNHLAMSKKSRTKQLYAFNSHFENDISIAEIKGRLQMKYKK